MEVGLIIPDVHERIAKMRRILKKYKHVQWVKFLGDFMDSFDGLTESTHGMISWLRNNVDNPKYEFLWGNHDIHYAYPINEVMCSGFDPHKLKLIQARMGEPQWNKFKLHTWIGEKIGNSTKPTEWMLSHAGIHPNLLHPILGYDRTALREMEAEAMFQLKYVQAVTPLIAAGRGRGGIARVGGLDWLDWDREFAAIPGLNQIVGHSGGSFVRTINTLDSYNYCIDTHLNHVMLVDADGSVKVHDAQ